MATNTTLSEFAADTDSATNRVLQMDDAVDELSPIQVKDVWVRGAIIGQLMKSSDPRAMHTDRFEWVEQKLKSGSPAVFREVAIQEFSDDVTDRLGWEDGPGNVEVMWNVLTDDKPDEKKVEVARAKIKEALRGCGMPRITVQREAVKYHYNHPKELTKPDA